MIVKIFNKNKIIYFRLAVNNMHYLSNVLGIKDPIHKQKIALKAMDVVLFGPPKGNIYCYTLIYDLYTYICDLNLYIIIDRCWTQHQRFGIGYIIIWSTYWMLVRISAKEKFTKASS